MTTVFNTNHSNKIPYMFFGEEQDIYRIDKLVHPQFDKLARRQKGFFWQPEEIDLTKDQKDFKMLDEGQRHIFTSTLTYQNMLDSVQGRGPGLTLLPHVSIPELEAFIIWWSAMEQTHADSYSYIVRNVYSNPTEVFDYNVINPNIIKRAKETTKYYDDFLNASINYRAGNGYISEFELKRKFLLMIASINMLEGLSFYESFACSFQFSENFLMVGNANIISLIARDEALHLAATQTILKLWREGKDDPDMKTLYFQELDTIKGMYENVVEQEKEWCSYLFSKGSMIGLNERILGEEYVPYIAGTRLKNLGIKHDYPVKNPLPWTLKYLNTSDKQVSPQEQEILTYVIGGIKNDLEDAKFNSFRV
jgi:ribonucleoside-diphosphate reductase beta chain